MSSAIQMVNTLPLEKIPPVLFYVFGEGYPTALTRYVKPAQLDAAEQGFYAPTVKHLTTYIEAAIGVLHHMQFEEAPPAEDIDRAINRFLTGVGTFEDALAMSYRYEIQQAELDALALGIQASDGELKVKVSVFDVKDPKALAYARSNAASLVKGVLDTTKTRMGEAIRDGLAGTWNEEYKRMESDTRDEIAARLQDIQRDLPDWRAKLIAQTETTRAINEGKIMNYQELGIEKWDWIPSGDACPICIDLAADSPYEMGDDRPPAHPGCRCVAVARFQNEASSGEF